MQNHIVLSFFLFSLLSLYASEAIIKDEELVKNEITPENKISENTTLSTIEYDQIPQIAKLTKRENPWYIEKVELGDYHYFYEGCFGECLAEFRKCLNHFNELALENYALNENNDFILRKFFVIEKRPIRLLNSPRNQEKRVMTIVFYASFDPEFTRFVENEVQYKELLYSINNHIISQQIFPLKEIPSRGNDMLYKTLEVKYVQRYNKKRTVFAVRSAITMTGASEYEDVKGLGDKLFSSSS